MLSVKKSFFQNFLRPAMPPGRNGKIKNDSYELLRSPPEGPFPSTFNENIIMATTTINEHTDYFREM